MNDLRLSTQESVIVVPPHGFQLETHTGFPLLPLKVTRRFIPTAYLQDIIINEALYGWNVRYYLAFLVNVDDERFSMEIAYKVRITVFYRYNSILTLFFQNIMPYFPILLKIYNKLHDSLEPRNNRHDSSNKIPEREHQSNNLLHFPAD